ncbi:kinetochore Sim4 complex subunit Fta4 [Limtongia smithiae]|uniref:kinetochore Sim4 complex subunit Fta4 n=1 Tax=Limtongia smithiae TaxID=1125753 RepID=UPI0034D015FC
MSYIYESKRAFLEAQVRTLAIPLKPSRQWTDENPEFASSAVVRRVFQKVHVLQRQHLRQLYSTEAMQHVALQLDKLYRNKVIAASTGISAVASAAGSTEQLILRGEADLTDAYIVESLPASWDELAGTSNDATEEDQEEYATLRDSLPSLIAALSSARRRAAHISEISQLLSTLADPVVNVQPNLVSREGDIEHELTRTRVLSAKLASVMTKRKS